MLPQQYDEKLREISSMQEMYPHEGTLPKTPEEQGTGAPSTSPLDQEISGMVTTRKRISEEWRQPKRQVWDKCWNHYKQVYDRTGKEPWQSTTFQPATTKCVEIIVANLHGAIMGPEMPVELQANNPDDEMLVRSHNEVIKTDFEKSKYKAHWTDFLRTLSILGTAVGKIDYVKQKETVMVKKRQRPGLLGSMLSVFGYQPQQEVFTEKEMFVKDYARFRNVDLYDIYPQPKITDITKDTWIIEKAKITNKELLEGARDPDDFFRLRNVTDALLSSGASDRVNEDPEKQTRKQAMLETSVPMHYMDPDREHELLEYFGPIPCWYLEPELRNDPQRKYESTPGWIWVVDGQYVVRCQRNPFRDGEPPYVRGNYIRIPGEFYGVGVAELMLGLQIQKNEIWNTKQDNVNLILNKIVAVLKDKIPQGAWKRLVSAPGAIWTFQGVDDIRKAVMPIDMPDITKDAYIASREVDNEIQETTAAVKATVGTGGAGDESGGGTFRGQLLNKQSATERFMLYARVLEICGLKDAIMKFYHRIYQFKSYEEVDAILGQARAANFDFIAPEELEKVARLNPIGVVSLEGKGVKLAQMQEFSKMWYAEPWLKKLEIARQQWVEMGFPDPDKAVFSDEEMKMYNDFQRAALGQMPGGQSLAGSPPPQGPSAGPIAGNVPGPSDGQPRPAMPTRGPGVSPIDVLGRPAA